MPYAVNKLFWTAQLLPFQPAGWSEPTPVPRETVLTTSPFSLHEITRVTEQRSGNVGQEQDRQLDRRELRFRGEPVERDESLAALEEWVLARYRQYRSLRRLPLAEDVCGEQSITREEDRQLDLYSTPLWASSNGTLSLHEALLSSPFQVWATLLQDSAPSEVQYRSAPSFKRFLVFGNDDVTWRADQLHEYAQVIEEVTLKLPAERWASTLTSRAQKRKSTPGTEFRRGRRLGSASPRIELQQQRMDQSRCRLEARHGAAS